MKILKNILPIVIILILSLSIYADWPPAGPRQEVTPETEGLGLEILSVDVSPSDPEPGEEVEVEIRLKNTAEEDIEDIRLDIEIDGLESDDGDDIEDSDEFDLRSGEEDDIDFEFDMPYDVEDRDSYAIEITLEGEGENSDATYEAEDSSKKITFDKKSHAIYIKRLDTSPSILSCNPSLNIRYEVWNIGSNDEEVEISLTNPSLRIDHSEEVDIDEDDKYENTVTLTPRLNPGKHDIELTIEYGSKEISDNIQIDIAECATKEPEEIKEYDEDKKEAKEKTQVKLTPAINTIRSDSESIAAKRIESDEFHFRETPTYTFLLIILFIIISGLVIYTIGALIILSKR